MDSRSGGMTSIPPSHPVREFVIRTGLLAMITHGASKEEALPSNGHSSSRTALCRRRTAVPARRVRAVRAAGARSCAPRARCTTRSA